jgi:hypothetical protein
MPGFQAAEAALDRTAARLTPLVQNRAVEAGWPETAASRLRMVRTEYGTLSLDYSGSQREAEDLEFGTQTEAPRSVLSMLAGADLRRVTKQTMFDSMDEVHDRLQGMFS